MHSCIYICLFAVWSKFIYMVQSFSRLFYFVSLVIFSTSCLYCSTSVSVFCLLCFRIAFAFSFYYGTAPSPPLTLTPVLMKQNFTHPNGFVDPPSSRLDIKNGHNESKINRSVGMGEVGLVEPSERRQSNSTMTYTAPARDL